VFSGAPIHTVATKQFSLMAYTVKAVLREKGRSTELVGCVAGRPAGGAWHKQHGLPA